VTRLQFWSIAFMLVVWVAVLTYGFWFFVG
jgi:hypothetical protein